MNNQQLAVSENQQQHSQLSIPVMSRSSLQPATAKAGTAELMACLTLVAPSGMTAEDRHAWVAVAKATLTGMPADLLAKGCRKARETCRFASEIVPTIVQTTKADWDWRVRMEAETARFDSLRLAPPREPPAPIPHEETQRILREVRTGTRA